MESQIFSKHCYVPGIVLGTEDATRNRAKSLPQWSQNSREQVSTLHGFLPFCGAMILGQESALFLILHPVHPPKGKIKEHCLHQPVFPPNHGIPSHCLPSQEQRLEEPLLRDIMCLFPGCGGSGPWLGLDLTLVSCPWENDSEVSPPGLPPRMGSRVWDRLSWVLF